MFEVERLFHERYARHRLLQRFAAAENEFNVRFLLLKALDEVGAAIVTEFVIGDDDVDGLARHGPFLLGFEDIFGAQHAAAFAVQLRADGGEHDGVVFHEEDCFGEV